MIRTALKFGAFVVVCLIFTAYLAFTIGMMHAIGQLVMHSGMAAEASALDKTVGPYEAARLQAERDAFGFDFAQVGAELANRWKFPDIFADTIRAFPDPAASNPASRMAGVVHLATWRTRAEELKLNPDELAATLPLAVAESLGLSADELLEDMPSLSDLSAGLEELIH